MYCQECGGELRDGVKFCKYCGARVDGLTSPSDGSKSFSQSNDGVEEMVPASSIFFDGPDEPEMISAAEFFGTNDSAEGDDIDEIDDDAEIEDGEVDDSKGLDPNRTYVMRFSGRSAELYNDWGQLIRRFNMRSYVTQATTNGETVTICTADGWTYLYYWTGQLIRRFH